MSVNKVVLDKLPILSPQDQERTLFNITGLGLDVLWSLIEDAFGEFDKNR